MARGRWGGRFPIANLLSTKLIFALVDVRIAARILVNKFRQRSISTKLTLRNSPHLRAELLAWIDAGYSKLNVGGGPKNLDGFVNIDFVAHRNVHREIVGNILDLEFVPDACLTHVHSNHVIEHLAEPDIIKQLAEYHRIIRPGGLLTIRCPNALGVTYGFWFDPILERDRLHFISQGFPHDEDFGNPEDVWLHRDLYGFLHWIYGDMGNRANEHLTIVTPTMLRNHLVNAGFTVVTMTEPEALNLAVIAAKSGP